MHFVYTHCWFYKNCNKRSYEPLTVLNIFHCFFYKIMLDISCESSAWQNIHMKHQALFSSKDKSKNNKVSSAAIWLGGLSVKVLNNGLGWTGRISEHLLLVRHFVLLSDLARDGAFHFCIKRVNNNLLQTTQEYKRPHL